MTRTVPRITTFVEGSGFGLRFLRLAVFATAAIASATVCTSFAQVVAAPSSITWAKVAVGQAGGPKAATLTNNSAVPVTISSIAFTGTNAGDFAIYQNTCGATLAPSASCTTTILFKPTNSGTRTATLLFTDSDSTSPQEVSVSGTGTGGAGSVTAAPASLSFGSINTGAASGSQAITISNTTSSAVSLSAGAITGANASEFAVTSTTCGASLAASATCAANIDFAPTSAGAASATWSLTDSNSTTPLTVSLAGTGTTSSGGNVTALPASITWASVAVGNAGGPKVATLTNNGSASVTISGITFTGANPGDFAIYKNTCTAPLAGSSNCTVTILFKPTTSGTRTALLTFSDSDPSSPQQITVSGTGTGGTSPGTVTASPATLSYGTVVMGSTSGSQSITVTNATASSVTLSAAAITGANAGDFVVTFTNCGSSLAASANCVASIVFQPSVTGPETASWTLTNSNSATPLSVSLSGTGTPSGSGGAGTTYYVSNCSTVGSDSNSGTDPTTPWLTIAKVNSFNFNPGDTVLFNDGCVWREQLVLPSPGTAASPITVGTYGSGTPPVISGSAVASSWITEPQGGNNFINDPNLQAYWDMNEVSGSTFLDLSTNGNNLTNVNGVTQTPSQFAGYQAAAFTPSLATMLTLASSAMSPNFIGNNGSTNANVTVGGWVYFNSTASNTSFVLKGSGKAWGLFLGVGSNVGKMEWQTYLNSGFRLVASNSVLTPGLWYHVVGRVNAATDEQALFINGVKQNNIYSTSNTTMFTDATPLNVGGAPGGAYLNGDVDDVFVFNRALSDSEIAEIYNSGFEGGAGSYNLYYVTGFAEPTVVYENGVAMTAAPQKSGMSQGSWWWDATDARVYIRPSGDVNPSTETIEIPILNTCITDSRNYTIINGLTCQEAIVQGVYVTANNVTVENMSIQHLRSNGPGTPNQNGYAVGIYWTGSNDTIENNTVTDANWGIFSDAVTGTTVNAGLVQSNTVSNIAYDGIGLAVSPINGGILANTVAQYNVVYNVGIYAQEGGALECIYGGSTIGTGNVIRYNLAYNNGTPTLHSYPLNVQGGAGSCSFYGNLVYNNYGPCLEIASGPGGNNFYNNTCYNNGLAGEGAGFFLAGGAANTGNQIENNIVYAGSGTTFMNVSSGTAAGNSFDYNLYFGGSATPFVWNGTAYSLSNYQATSGQDAHAVNADPQFNNQSAKDFTLQSTSPAIGAGVNLGPNYQFDLQPGSVWPSNVTTANQNNSSNWTIGAYVYLQGNQ